MKNPLTDKIYHSRKIPRTPDIRGDYFRDQTAIIHATPFRRLKYKTQVFFSPQNDHICTRIEHVLHVSTIASTICKGLNLDIELAQAIALGHDLGHAPFGHIGEQALNSFTSDIGGFIHELLR
ncbi:MAG: HD domain-containing protein [bacterium]